MELSLQPKKFVNSERMGSSLKISLPYGKKESPIPCEIHYVDEGSGEPLILIHSIGQSLYTYRYLINDLKRYYRVIALDLFGFGYSDKSPYCLYTLNDQAMILRLFMDKLGIKSAHIVAYSMGCAYAVQLAKKNPSMVGRMVLLSPGGISSQMPVFIKLLEIPIVGSLAATLINKKVVSDALTECFLDLTMVTADMIEGYFSALDDFDTKKAIYQSVRNYDEDEALADTKSFSTPTLILWGSEDKWHSPDFNELYETALNSAKCSVVRNAGHLLHEEKPDKVLAAILEFIPALRQEAPEDSETEPGKD